MADGCEISRSLSLSLSLSLSHTHTPSLFVCLSLSLSHVLSLSLSYSFFNSLTPLTLSENIQTQEFLEFLLRTGRMSSDQSTVYIFTVSVPSSSVDLHQCFSLSLCICIVSVSPCRSLSVFLSPSLCILSYLSFWHSVTVFSIFFLRLSLSLIVSLSLFLSHSCSLSRSGQFLSLLLSVFF
jgi:hypothetical protein